MSRTIKCTRADYSTIDPLSPLIEYFLAREIFYSNVLNVSTFFSCPFNTAASLDLLTHVTCRSESSTQT